MNHSGLTTPRALQPAAVLVDQRPECLRMAALRVHRGHRSLGVDVRRPFAGRAQELEVGLDRVPEGLDPLLQLDLAVQREPRIGSGRRA